METYRNIWKLAKFAEAYRNMKELTGTYRTLQKLAETCGNLQKQRTVGSIWERAESG
jgi:hypothetical protein